jgi:hypothetical protein
MFNACRTVCRAPHFESIGCSDQEASNPQEEASRFEAHTRFDEAVSDSPSGVGLETGSWLTSHFHSGILNRGHAADSTEGVMILSMGTR